MNRTVFLVGLTILSLAIVYFAYRIGYAAGMFFQALIVYGLARLTLWRSGLIVTVLLAPLDMLMAKIFTGGFQGYGTLGSFGFFWMGKVIVPILIGLLATIVGREGPAAARAPEGGEAPQGGSATPE